MIESADVVQESILGEMGQSVWGKRTQKAVLCVVYSSGSNASHNFCRDWKLGEISNVLQVSRARSQGSQLALSWSRSLWGCTRFLSIELCHLLLSVRRFLPDWARALYFCRKRCSFWLLEEDSRLFPLSFGPGFYDLGSWEKPWVEMAESQKESHFEKRGLFNNTKNIVFLSTALRIFNFDQLKWI